MSDISGAPGIAASGTPPTSIRRPSADRRPSAEAKDSHRSPSHSPPGPTRLKKKSSIASVQQTASVNAASASPTPASSDVTRRQSPTPAKAARKSSLRNAMRRMFGKKAKSEATGRVQSQAERSIPRHGHTISDPTALRVIPEQPQGNLSPTNSIPQRAVSAPFNLADRPSSHKPRTAYAVEFPQSSRLKPLDLGNPFHKEDKEPRRRATLPSIVMDEREAAALVREMETGGDDYNLGQGQGDPAANYYGEGIGLAVTTPILKQHRKSRSADDLRRMVRSLEPERDRDEEVNYWRQSTAGSILFQPPPEAEDDVIETTGPGPYDRTSSTIGDTVSPLQPLEQDPFAVAEVTHGSDDGKVSPLMSDTTGKISPMRDSPLMSRPTTADQPKGVDLESRVLQLENSLAGFQVALDRLTTSANRRTFIIDGTASARNTRGNTPSVLISSLLDSDYRYSGAFGGTDETYNVRSSGVEESPRQRQSSSQPSPARTHAALYSIINQERVARRAMEDQLRNLQDRFSELQYQLSQPILGRHSSVYQPQLQPQMQTQTQTQTQAQGPAGYQQIRHFSNAPTDTTNQRLTSRFSRSDSLTDSEAARLREASLDMDDDRHRSFDLYRMPTDEQRQRARVEVGEGDMF